MNLFNPTVHNLTRYIQSRIDKHNIFLSRCNVADENDWFSTWSHTEKHFGGKVQLLVNNAGVNPHHGWKTCMDVMIYGVMMGSFIARDRMGKTKVNPRFLVYMLRT